MEMMLESDFMKALVDHELWVKSDGALGKQASFKGKEISHTEDIRMMDLSKIDFSGCRLVETTFIGCAIYLANFEGATITDCCFSGCGLAGSKLIGSEIYSTSFRLCSLFNCDFPKDIDADEIEVESCCADGTSIFSFNLSRHPGFYVNGKVKIGYECHTVEHWMENYKIICTEYNYCPEDIDLYGAMIQYIHKIFKQ